MLTGRGDAEVVRVGVPLPLDLVTMADSRQPKARLPAGFPSLLLQPIFDLFPHRYRALSKSTEEIAVLDTM